MKITEEIIQAAKKAYDNREEVVGDELSTAYAKALTRNSKKLGLPIEKYVAVKQESGTYIIEMRKSETCTAEGRD